MKGKGRFITFEGGEGSGKTTVIRCLAQRLQEEGYPVIATREPGGIEIAEQIRSVILDTANTTMDARTEALLYAAARRQHLVERVEPAIEEGKMVLCDRFVDSSMAYQGHARGIGMTEVGMINQFATNARQPDVTYYLDIEPELGLTRIASNQRDRDRLDREGLEFHYMVKEGYSLLIEQNPERICVIDASRSIEDVTNDIYEHLKKRILPTFLE
ncbi:dTMP kinase [Paenibacillus massiliensis]|uniref:dTMP kinase n=1 Tax=Paenibacillus massiliensis TaxID=225917 RepID=UPI00036576C1|nr:dTMP kinase [Paenibacillus massiliensis]